MPLEQIGQVLGTLQRQPAWREQQQFQHLLTIWVEVVGPVVAQQTRPLAITQQQVLRVATSSSVWSQNLSFERQLILQKLNARLPQPFFQPFVDLQFSTRHWPRQQKSQPGAGWAGVAGSGDFPDPSWATLRAAKPQAEAVSAPPAQPTDSATAFRGWSRAIHRRSARLPLCPQCRCPTPAPELERWSVCNLCASRRNWRQRG